jgi:hypothetical protein
MYHYGTSTSMFWRGIRAQADFVWGQYIPSQAFRFPWLMHGLLAATALHLAHSHRDRTAHFLRLADKHQTVALSAFRSVLATDINVDNADALFGLASILSISAMARACGDAETADVPGAMSMDSVTEFFFLTRGVSDVIRACNGYVQQGPMHALFDIQRLPDDAILTLPSSVIDQFDGIQQMLHEWDLDPEALRHCEGALADLRHIYEAIAYFSPDIIETGTVWRWPINVPTPFVRLVQACCQPALVIFAHFAAAAIAVRPAWYNRDWSDYAIIGVSVNLDESMQHWLEWPRAQAKDRLAILGVQPPVVGASL